MHGQFLVRNVVDTSWMAIELLMKMQCWRRV